MSINVHSILIAAEHKTDDKVQAESAGRQTLWQRLVRFLKLKL